jgi:hypothetical protein
VILPTWSAIELKHLDAEEFAHWSHMDFDASERTRRKRREVEVFRILAEGGQPPAGVVAMTSPDARHVIDYVSWMLADDAWGDTQSQARTALQRLLPRSSEVNGSSQNDQ